GLTLGKVKKAVHGIDLGPMTSCLPRRLRTSDKRIDLAPEILVKDLDRVRDWLSQHSINEKSPESNGQLLLIGRRQLRSNNSWMHNSQRLVRSNSTKPQ